jgi:hypothetical protein
MSTEHHKHDDQRLKPNATGDQADDPGRGPASVIAEIPGDDADASGESAAHEKRWHDVLADFIDDPRAAVLAATELVVDDVSAFVGVLDQRKKGLLNASLGDEGATTEDLRQAVATFRDISKQLTASIHTLRVTDRGKREREDRAREDRVPEQREVIGGRFEAARARQVVGRREPPSAQTPPGKPSGQDQRR